ncbi:MAG: hypothetical protein LBS21_08095 [Clostridiales bacterium]|nr:hypothetical protein [Clostridiales bacterium]
MEGYGAKRFESDSEWKIIREGCGEGTLIGGYTSIFALMLTNEYFAYNKDKKYILFLEDHERFSGVGAVATYLAFISQSAFMRSVTALIFGHFSVNVPPDLLRVLQRFGERHNIPVVYTDDFGHGNRHAVLPIGVNAELNTSNDKAAFNFPQPPLSEKS